MWNHWTIITAFITMLACGKSAANELPAPVFHNASQEVNPSGYLKLSWDWEGDVQSSNFEVQQADNEAFAANVAIYRGKDYATFLSGLDNGSYFYRVRAISEDNTFSEWSEPVSVQVKHHSLTLAFTLFGVGAFVFLMTVGIVVKGARDNAV